MYFYTKVKLNENIKIALVNLKLRTAPNSTDLAIGYGHVKDSEKLNAISSIQNRNYDFSNYSNMYELIQGRVPGGQIVGRDIIIRGQNSINSSSAALIVVDGVVSDSGILDVLSPLDVKSIDF